jgi:hypothetical protein
MAGPALGARMAGWPAPTPRRPSSRLPSMRGVKAGRSPGLVVHSYRPAAPERPGCSAVAAVVVPKIEKNCSSPETCCNSRALPPRYNHEYNTRRQRITAQPIRQSDCGTRSSNIT